MIDEVVGAVSGVALVSGVGVWAARKALSTSPRGIVRHLQKPGDSYRISLWILARGWNPAMPLGRDNGILGPGRAVYSLDESGIAHLQYQPKIGPALVVSGPVPERLRQRRHPQRKLAAAARATFCLAVGGGFALGDLLSNGSEGRHLAAGALGAFAGMVALQLAVLFLRVVRSMRSLGGRGQ